MSDVEKKKMARNDWEVTRAGKNWYEHYSASAMEVNSETYGV